MGLTAHNWSRITSLPHEPNWELEVTSQFAQLDGNLVPGFHLGSSLVQRDLAAPTRRAQDMSHRGEGKAVLVISQVSHNLSVSLSNHYSVKNLKLTQVEHACSHKIPPPPSNLLLSGNSPSPSATLDWELREILNSLILAPY